LDRGLEHSEIGVCEERRHSGDVYGCEYASLGPNHEQTSSATGWHFVAANARSASHSLSHCG
jgi:hypothetical protein